MNSLEVYAALKTLPLNTMVYAANHLPNTIATPCAIVVNTDPDYKPGAHWIAIYIDKSRNGEFFDSYGLQPIVKSHKAFLRSNCKKLTCNRKKMQSLNSSVCGQYCLLFLHFRASGHSMSEFQRLFSTNTIKNDFLLKTKFQQCFKIEKYRKSETHRNIQACCCRRRY